MQNGTAAAAGGAGGVGEEGGCYGEGCVCGGVVIGRWGRVDGDLACVLGDVGGWEGGGYDWEEGEEQEEEGMHGLCEVVQ